MQKVSIFLQYGFLFVLGLPIPKRMYIDNPP